MKTFITTIALTLLTLTTFAQKVGPMIGTITLTQPTCYGYSNGEITITPSGGLEPYTYLWSNGETTQTISNLSAGNYSVIVNDAMGQTLGGFFTVPQPEQIIVQGIVTNATMNQPNGSIDITGVSNTSGNYTWEWTSNNTQSFNLSSLDQTNLMAGIYKLKITDVNGCQAFTEFQVNKIITPFNKPGFTLPGSNNNPSKISIQGNDAQTTENTKVYLDMMGREVTLETSPSGYYLITENGITVQKIYKN